MRTIKSASLCLLVVILTAACASVPITGRHQLNLMPTGTLLSMSHEQYNEFLGEHEISDDEAQTQMVVDVGNDIADAVEKYLEENGRGDTIQNYDWEFNLVEDDSINAFCMPGGKVVVFTGIMSVANDKNGLAVIMGHEIAHAVARHGNERMSQGLLTQFGGMALSKALESRPAATQQLFMAAFGAGAQIGVLLPYSRLHEREADHLGLIFMAKAGYDPNEAPRFWERMSAQKQGNAPPEFLSTHPADKKRIQNLEALIPKAMEFYE